jgi:putative ABC transport system permease protein
LTNWRRPQIGKSRAWGNNLVTKLVLENLKHRPVRTLLTVLAIGLQVTLVLTIIGLSRGLVEASATRNRGVGADITIRPPGTSVIGMSTAPMQEALVRFCEKQPHVAIAQGVVMHGVGGLEAIAGIDIDQFNRMSGGFDYLSGGPFQQQDDIIIDENYARQNNLKVGDKLTLANHDWTVRAIVGVGKLSKAFVQKPVLQELTANTGKVSMIYLKLDDPKHTTAVIESLKKQLEGYQIYSMEELISLITPTNIPGLSPFISVVVGLAIVFGFLVVFLAMYTAVLERTREVGILKALGASPGFIVGLLIRETVLLSIIGSIIGILLAFVARWVILSIVPASLQVLIVPEWWWRAALIALAAGVFGSLYPGLKAAKQDTVEALAYE